MDYFGPGQVDMKQFRQMYIVVSAIPLVLLLLTFVLWFMSNDGWETAAEPVPALQYALFAMLAAASLPVALLVRRSLLREGTGAGRPMVPGWTPQHVAAGRITQVVTIGMAFPEISVLLGFVLGFLSQSWTVYIPFAAYSVLGWAVMYPRPQQVRAWYANQMAQSVPAGVTPPAPL